MNTSCEIIRDILPLYADGVCSEASREMVEAHLPECPACAEYLAQIRSSEAEGTLESEKALVIQNQARHFKRRSATIGSVIAALFMIPILICLIVNMTSGRTLDWFFVAASGMLVAASLIVVPLMMPEDKAFWTFCAFCASLMILLAVCCLYTRGKWFFTAASASLFGLSVVFMPFVIKARPLKRWVDGRNKALLVLAADVVLFANMMNMITLSRKSILLTALMAVLTVAVPALLASEAIMKERDK